MKKFVKLSMVSLMFLSMLSVGAFAAQGSTVTVSSAGNKASGYVYGERTSSGCYAATNVKSSSSNTLRAYVEIVNSQGYVIGAGSSRTGVKDVTTRTLSRNGGYNAYGSIGFYDTQAYVYCRLY